MRCTRIAGVALLATTLLGALLLTAGCGTGQISQTADIQPAVPGANSTVGPSADNAIQLRNVVLAYPGVDGYRQGATAQLQVHLFNTGKRPVTLVRVTTDAAARVSANGEPVRVTVPVDGRLTLGPGGGQALRLDGVTRAIRSGESAKITFTFDNGADYTLDVPVGLPTAPVPPGSAVFNEASGG